MGEFTPEMQEKIDAAFPLYEKEGTPTHTVKLKFRGVAADLLMDQARATTGHAKRSLAEALTLLETASMFAVKALHQG
jgi:hypothetical protein